MVIPCIVTCTYMGGSWNGGTLKSSILVGFALTKTNHLGDPPFMDFPCTIPCRPIGMVSEIHPEALVRREPIAHVPGCRVSAEFLLDKWWVLGICWWIMGNVLLPRSPHFCWYPQILWIDLHWSSTKNSLNRLPKNVCSFISRGLFIFFKFWHAVPALRRYGWSLRPLIHRVKALSERWPKGGFQLVMGVP